MLSVPAEELALRWRLLERTVEISCLLDFRGKVTGLCGAGASLPSLSNDRLLSTTLESKLPASSQSGCHLEEV